MGVKKKSSTKARKAPQATSREDGPGELEFPRPCVAVDLVIFTITDSVLQLLVIKRSEPPFRGEWALPGGFVRVGATADDQGEDLEDAARRELSEETGLPEGAVFLEQLYSFGRSNRDPRTRVISVAYYALVRPDLAPFVEAGGDAASASWIPASDAEETELAFDHNEIVTVALDRIRGKIDYSAIAFELVPQTFTVRELRAVHEVVKGTAYDPGNFRRRFQRMMTDGIIEEARGKRLTSSKPAKVFSFRREGPE